MLTRTALLSSLLLLTACGSSSTPEAPTEPSPTPAPEAPAAPEPPAHDHHAAADPGGDYRSMANELVAAIDGGDAAAVGALARKLTDAGVALVEGMKGDHPICGPYFDAILAAAPTMTDLSLEAIEADYHADGKLPQMPAPKCYHGKDLVVHPATVVVLARGGLTDKDAAKAEITEVLAHLDEALGKGEAKAEAAAGATVVVEATDSMQFSVTTIEAVAGTPVTLELKHVGTLEKAVMGHNWVLLAEGTDLPAFAAAAMTAKDTEYIPAAQKDRVLAHTKLIGGGESDTITFTVETPGTYEFLCSFPGHSTLMKGTLVVKAG